MKKIFLFIGFLLTTMALAAQNKYDGVWWNGTWFASCTDTTNNKLVFQGGSMHEGGYGFTLKETKENRGEYRGRHEEIKKFELKKIKGRDYLFVKTVGNTLHNIFEKKTEEIDLFLEATQYMAKLLLDGNYKTLSGNTKISIDAKTMTIDDGKKKEKFYIPVGNLSYPIENYILCSATHGYEYTRPKYGELILTPVKVKLSKRGALETYKEGCIIPDGKPIHLKRINNADANGCYPIFSKEIVLPGYLEYLSIEELNTARNEIFARHGYKFSNPKLEKIFKATTWYKCKNDNAEIKLSIIEQINVDVLMLK